MPKKEIEVGDIRPVYNIAGFEVCKITSDKPEEIEWTPVEKQNEAEVLSFIYRQETTEKTTENKNNKKGGRTKKEIKKELKKTEKKIKELEDEEEVDDEDL